MASIIVPSNLTVTISESYELNGVTYGNTLSKIYTSNSQVSQRVMNIEGKGDGTVFTNILALSTADGQGQVKKTDYKYFRITNLDTVNTLNLRIYNGTEYFAFEVSPASTFLLQDAGTDSPATASTVIAFSDITLIAGQSSSVADTVDVEFIIVTA
tara:strand:- start:852 stop:1319 length:468 start_codon:yes stop_codon:yes gene_type:complete